MKPPDYQQQLNAKLNSLKKNRPSITVLAIFTLWIIIVGPVALIWDYLIIPAFDAPEASMIDLMRYIALWAILDIIIFGQKRKN